MGGGGDNNDNPCQEISTPLDRSMGSKRFKNKEGHEIRWDPPRAGGSKPAHWHVTNPNWSGNHDKYLDMLGNPVAKGSDASHLSADDLANLMEKIGGGTC